MAQALALRGDLYRILYKRVGNSTDVEDIVQEAYLCFHKRLLCRKFSLEQPIRRYLFKVAINRYRIFFRKKRHAQLVEEPVQNHADYYSCLEENMEYLREKLDKNELLVLLRLIRFSPLEVKVISSISDAPDEEFERFKSRLSKLARYYMREGRVVLPPYEIEGISFSPLRIRFQQRNYGKNPLKFFQENIDVYGEMSRVELSHFDQTLYAALRKAGQIQEAIPKDGRSVSIFSLPKEEVEKINFSYHKFNRYARAAARALNYGEHTILKYWKQAGFEIRKNNGLLKNEKLRIIRAFKKHNGVVLHTSRELGHSRAVITKVWKEAGLF